MSGFVGLPEMPVPTTVWPANVCAKLPPGAVIRVAVVAPLKSMLVVAADAAETDKNADAIAAANRVCNFMGSAPRVPTS